MQLNDKIQMTGVFSIKTYNDDGTFEEYTEKNLIMDLARTNMAQLIGGVNSTTSGEPINKFVLGTSGHVGDNILDYKKVGENNFNSTRSGLFSEVNPTDISEGKTNIADAGLNYRIPFDASGNNDVTVEVPGAMYNGYDTLVNTDVNNNTINRVVNGSIVTYTVTIPTTNANGIEGLPIAFTEAALYAGSDIFSMKTFSSRVKENTVKCVIQWSIIF